MPTKFEEWIATLDIDEICRDIAWDRHYDNYEGARETLIEILKQCWRIACEQN